MNGEFEIGDDLTRLVDGVVRSYRADERTRHIGQSFFPSRTEIGELIERLLELVYPGFFGRQGLTDHNVAYHVGELIPRIAFIAHRQVYRSLCYHDRISRGGATHDPSCEARADELTREFLNRLPGVRARLADDVQAAVDGDPAATGCDEVVLAYPGMLAVSVYRLAHELHELRVPLIPRVMTEWAHRMTGVDIHPGATVGRSFFIDHGTGVVIGETTHIGDNVKVYQGVTLGALSFPKDAGGRIIREAKRHPTVEDRVTIYANAIILGGETVIGHDSVIGGSVFLTSSVPPRSTVTFAPPDLRIKGRDGVSRLHDGKQQTIIPDYQI
ncbi:MAG: serine acetyltransferase [Phycisphaerales bacterium]|nr:serine acetyltransferase [Phycisphaerales bacterium]